MVTTVVEREKKVPEPTLVEPFVARVNDCVRQVVEVYPTEVLYWVRGTGSVKRPLQVDKDVDLLDLQFQKVVAHAVWNRIEPPVQEMVGLGVQVMVPVETLIPLADAIQQMGSKPFVKVELSWPVTPEVKQPVYTFELVNGEVVRVNAVK